MYTIPGFNFSFGTPKFTDLTSTFSNATFKIDPTFKGFDYTPTSLLNLTGKKITPITDVPRQSFPAGSGVPSFTPTTKFYSKSLGKTLTAQEVMAMGSVAASVMQTPLANYIKNLNLTPVEETNFQTAPNKKIEDASKNFGNLLNQKATAPVATSKDAVPAPFDTSKIQPKYEDIASGGKVFAAKTAKSSNLPSNAKYVAQQLKDRLNLTREQIAGILGNFEKESGFRPGINEGEKVEGAPKNRGGYGIAQWTGSRQTDLINFAKSRKIPVNDIKTQTDFLIHELQTTEKNALQKLKGALSPTEASDRFLVHFERAGIPKAKERRTYAERMHGALDFLNQPPSTSSVPKQKEVSASPQEFDKNTAKNAIAAAAEYVKLASNNK